MSNPSAYYIDMSALFHFILLKFSREQNAQSFTTPALFKTLLQKTGESLQADLYIKNLSEIANTHSFGENVKIHSISDFENWSKNYCPPCVAYYLKNSLSDLFKDHVELSYLYEQLTKQSIYNAIWVIEQADVPVQTIRDILAFYFIEDFKLAEVSDALLCLSDMDEIKDLVWNTYNENPDLCPTCLMDFFSDFLSFQEGDHFFSLINSLTKYVPESDVLASLEEIVSSEFGVECKDSKDCTHFIESMFEENICPVCISDCLAEQYADLYEEHKELSIAAKLLEDFEFLYILRQCSMQHKTGGFENLVEALYEFYDYFELTNPEVLGIENPEDLTAFLFSEYDNKAFCIGCLKPYFDPTLEPPVTSLE